MNINFEDALIDIVADGASDEEILNEVKAIRDSLDEATRQEELEIVRDELIENIIDYAELLLNDNFSLEKRDEYRHLCEKAMTNAEKECLEVAKKLDKVKTALKDDDIITDFLRELGY